MSREWQDRKSNPATEDMVNAKWGLNSRNFRCDLCGHDFAVGDIYRWCYMNDQTPSPGNFFVCAKCDEPGLEDRMRDALSRHKPHMDDWVLLYLLAESRRKTLIEAAQRLESGCGEHDQAALVLREMATA